MSTVAASLQRAVCTLTRGDRVSLDDGTQRVIEQVLNRCDNPSPFVVLRFADGGSKRLHPGVIVTVTRT